MKVFLLVLISLAFAARWQDDVLEIFNAQRHGYSLAPLQWEAVLEASALKSSQRCFVALDDMISGQGEIVVRGLGVAEADAPKLMAALLVAEGQDWNCSVDLCISGGCQHNRQIIWETTTQVGCGVTNCGSKGYELVCHFAPVGNIVKTHPLVKGPKSCPVPPQSPKRGYGQSCSSFCGGLAATCLSGWNPSGNAWGGGWSLPSGGNNWGTSSGSSSGGYGGSSGSSSGGYGGSSGSSSGGYGGSSGSSSGGYGGSSSRGYGGGYRLTQTQNDATVLTYNPLWAWWNQEGRSVTVDAGFDAEADGTVHPIPGQGFKGLDWTDEVLEIHNAERASFGLKPLVWDTALAAGANIYAQHCTLKPSLTRSLGESLAIGTGVDGRNAPKMLAAIWANEIFDWNCTTDKCSSGLCSHHRQMIWAETTKVGCGFATCSKGFALVCRYDVAGNVGTRHPLESMGPSRCDEQPGFSAIKKTRAVTGGYGGGSSSSYGGGCGNLLAACLSGYGSSSTSSWSSSPPAWSGCSGGGGWGPSGEGWGNAWTSNGGSSYGQSSGQSGYGSGQSGSGSGQYGSGQSGSGGYHKRSGYGGSSGGQQCGFSWAPTSSSFSTPSSSYGGGGATSCGGSSSSFSYSKRTYGGSTSTTSTAGWNSGSSVCSASSSSSGYSKRYGSSGSSGSSSCVSNGWGSSGSQSWGASTPDCGGWTSGQQGWGGGQAGWGSPSGGNYRVEGNVGAQSFHIKLGGQTVQTLNPVLEWYNVDGRSARVDPGVETKADGTVVALSDSEVSGTHYIGSLPRNTAIVVIVVCCVVGVLLLALIAAFVLTKRKPSYVETV